MSGALPYHELHRPQFHFSPRTNWTNDPNGMVYYKGEYHLFYQLNAQGLRWGPNTWGHAVSRDLVHWEQLAHAIEPDEYGWIWSGSAVVDGNNTSGLREGPEDTLVAVYSTGGVGRFGYPNTPVVQKIHYSNDRGRTWKAFAGNPVLPHLRAENRDPKVIWHEPSRQWVMALYLDANDFVLFGSHDLKKWNKLCDVPIPGTTECPDFFPLAVDGDTSRTMWVFWGGAGVYLLGSFDGRRFTPSTEPLKSELGANGYAAQTWSDVPAANGRRIQLSWMAGGKYPSMPFNQQMTFPVELSLRTFPEGVRLCRQPVSEIALLNDRPHHWKNETLTPEHRIVPSTRHDLFNITASVELGGASAFGLILRGIDLRYHVAEEKFTYLGRDVPAATADGTLDLQVLLDRTSMELFAGGGKTSASFCFLPEAWDAPLELYAEGGSVKLVDLCVRELSSIWS
jgi:sucrose-6-phosphate hydrolase SacC (GH32 family)